mmetsp:Transcript_5935/g.20210  ORF Transcript_5935/g.20210 Transcript_5935/m.20210 type:complete len:345 (+) Transcript_5935:443-1477(+)
MNTVPEQRGAEGGREALPHRHGLGGRAAQDRRGGPYRRAHEPTLPRHAHLLRRRRALPAPPPGASTRARALRRRGARPGRARCRRLPRRRLAGEADGAGARRHRQVPPGAAGPAPHGSPRRGAPAPRPSRIGSGCGGSPTTALLARHEVRRHGLGLPGRRGRGPVRAPRQGGRADRRPRRRGPHGKLDLHRLTARDGTRSPRQPRCVWRVAPAAAARWPTASVPARLVCALFFFAPPRDAARARTPRCCPPGIPPSTPSRGRAVTLGDWCTPPCAANRPSAALPPIHTTTLSRPIASLGKHPRRPTRALEGRRIAVGGQCSSRCGVRATCSQSQRLGPPSSCMT